MEKKFLSVEDVVADETFLSWFYKESASKIQEWEEWVAVNPEQISLIDEAVNAMSQLQLDEQEIPEEQKQLAFHKLTNSINEAEGTTPVLSIKKPRKRWWIAAAAAAVIIFAAGITLYEFTQHKNIISTQYGQLSQQILPDGSEVMLNANSTVRLSQTWSNDHDREVWLQGEAFFHVTKTSTHNRFIVHTNQLDVIVTGTQFNVVSRSDKTNVLLTEGSVTIKTREGNEIKMTHGEYVEFRNNEIQKTSANQEAVLAWKDSNILFDKTPMAEVARMITEHYGVKVKLPEDSSSLKPVSGLLNNNNLDVLLKALEATKNYKIVRTNNEIIISSL